MSQSASAKFFGKVNANAALQQEVATAQGKQDTQKYQQMLSTEGELNDEALEKVAGGGGGRRH